MLDERLVRWWTRHPVRADAAVTLVLLALCAGAGLLVGADPDSYAFSVALLAPLAVRRRWPTACAAIVAAVALTQWLTVRDTTGALPADIAVPLAIHALAAHGTRRASHAGLAAGLGGAVLGGISWPQLPLPALAHVLVGVSLAGIVSAAWLAGSWQRARRHEITALTRHAALREQQQREHTRLAVLEERTRIARDLHDILAHSLAVVIAQADGGRYAARAEPGRAVEALSAIGDQARAALADTRRAIGVLREDPGTGPDAAPAPGIADLPALAADLRGAGLPVTLAVDLPGPPLDSGVGLLVYRIVQEGLTNVVKHAGTGAAARVSVRADGPRLRVEVADDGTAGPSGTRPGYGLIGMRERVGAYGGSVDLRHRPGGGHRLAAVIPLGQP
ncbi:sensor histidine kinase [Nocardia thailandica]|uniref:histidine kinase n=1 Tax=Nocardia thailandica TaxID=257275 RepID=A0ABW6PRQ0_9NOCA|nr:sensor histidine kinase [Nocardia thailandica]